MASDLLLLTFFLFRSFVGRNCDTTVGRVAHHIMYDVCHLLFQLVDKLLGIVLLMLNVAELLLPDACEFTTLQQLFANQVDEFYACRCRHQALSLSLDIVALEECLDDRGA